MMTIFCGNEDIELQRGSPWPRFTRKVGGGIAARAEGSVCPLALGVYIRVPSGGAGAASGLSYPFFTVLTRVIPSHSVGRYNMLSSLRG